MGEWKGSEWSLLDSRSDEVTGLCRVKGRVNASSRFYNVRFMILIGTRWRVSRHV
jgi:hypothetical protein